MAKGLKIAAYLFVVTTAMFYLGLIWSFTPNDTNWRAVADSTIRRFEGPGVSVEGRLYLFFGFLNFYEQNNLLIATNDVSSYDPVTDTWTRHAPAPFTGTHVNGVYDGDFVWFAGGFVGNHPGRAVTTVWKFDADEDAWSQGPPLPAARGGGALVLAENELHYISGYYGVMEEPSSDNHWVLDLNNQAAGWRDEAPLPVSRGHAAGVAIGEYIYLIGGSMTHHPRWFDTRLLNRYNIRTDAWEQLADIPYPLSHIEPGAFFYGDNIVVAGGRNSESAQLSEMEVQDILIYRPAEDDWQLAGSLPLPLRAPVVRYIDDKLIVTTGSTYWANEASKKTYVLECTGKTMALCAENASAGSLSLFKLRLKASYKRLAEIMPSKVQTAMGLKYAARLD